MGTVVRTVRIITLRGALLVSTKGGGTSGYYCGGGGGLLVSTEGRGTGDYWLLDTPFKKPGQWPYIIERYLRG